MVVNTCYHTSKTTKTPTISEFSWAGDGGRTRDLLVGNETFYHWTTPAWLCREPDLHWWPQLFQSCALLTELSRQKSFKINFTQTILTVYCLFVNLPKPPLLRGGKMVDPRRLELLTSRMPCARSTNWAMGPNKPWCPREDSNFHFLLRRETFCPLNYEGCKRKFSKNFPSWQPYYMLK